MSHALLMSPRNRDQLRIVRIGILVLACAAGAGGRVYLASRGHNYDMETWTMTADLVVGGKNVYANTFRHPYGPPWFLILGGLRWVHDALELSRLGEESFHIVVTVFLTLADLAIAWLLLRCFGLVAAVYFILNPVGMLITGYHTQIDNLALLPALGAWLLVAPDEGRPRAVSWRRLLVSAVLMGVSLATKHVMLFFPIWIVLCSRVIGGAGRRMLHGALGYAVLVAICLPFLFAPAAWIGFREYVIGYEGLANRTLLLHVIDLIAPPGAVDSLFGLLPEILLRRIFIVLVLICGWFLARRAPAELFNAYLLAMVVFTYSMADQYLAIPLIACAIHWRRWPAWIYLVPATLLLYWAAADAGAVPPPQPRWYAYGTGLSYQHAQIWLAILLAMILLKPTAPAVVEAQRSPQESNL